MLTAQTALLVAMPVLTRLHDPADFGAWAVVAAVVGVLAPVSALRLELAIPIPESRADARDALLLALHAALALALLVVAALAWQLEALANALSLPADRQFLLWAVPIAVLLTGASQSLQYWGVRVGRYRRVARGRATHGVATAAFQVGLGTVAASPASLVAGDLIGRAASAGYLGHGLLRGEGSATGRYDPGTLVRSLVRFRGFATYSSLAALLNALGLYLPMLLVGGALGLPAAGLLLLGQRVMSLPTTMLVAAVSQVFVAEFARAGTPGERLELYRRTLARFAALTAPVFLLLAVLSPTVFPLVFGGDWGTAGRVAAALAPYFFLQLLSGGTISAIDVLQAHRARLIREVIFLAGTGGVLLGGLRSGLDVVGLAIGLSAWGIAFYGGSIAWVSGRVRSMDPA